jgi:glycosyltransferase involved in cell wall biosynthesis
MIDENMTVPADRRVWREAKALSEARYSVSIICPKGPGFEKRHETLAGVEIYRHRAWEGSAPLGYLLEYAWALAAEFWLALRIYARTRFRILHACNPPDTMFLIALFFKLFGVRFVFDHHDPTPEFYSTRFQPKGLVYRLALLAEWLSFRVADVTISTNDALRETALTRSGVSPESSFVVRTCPDLDDFPPQPPRLELKQGRKYLVVYVGTMGMEDGVDLLLESIEYLYRARGRNDVLFVLIGGGPEFRRLKAEVTKRGFEGCVKFTGALYGDDLKAYLATADVGVAPDPSNAFNDKLTMVKILEYMAYGMPVVLYDLPEGRQSAGGAALYAGGNDPLDFAEKIAQLLDSKSLREQLGMVGRRRVVEKLNWGIERQRLLKAYQAALGNNVSSVLAT